MLYSNKSVDKYLSPLSHMIHTTVPFSIVGINFNAAATAPPLLIPEKTPSSLANRLAICFASSSETSIS